MTQDTIFALSSGQPPAAIGIIRVSGADASAALHHLTGKLPAPRRATLATVKDGLGGPALDSALALWFPGPNTATGEDLAELHCHGGRAVTTAVLNVLARLPNCRMAEPGEFTRRAFENGRIDLNEAEGLADLLFAETETQRQAAMAMMQGHFSKTLAKWEKKLLKLSAMAEAALDFSDEDDVPGEGIESEIMREIAELALQVQREGKKPSAERLRDGVRVVIAGPPNAGKSTLLNAIAGRDAAIVSDIAGTTRDLIDVPVALSGIAFLLTDTAGLREDTADVIETIGIERASSAISSADIVLWMGDSEGCPRHDSMKVSGKADIEDYTHHPNADFIISAITGQGMSELISAVVQRARSLLPREGEYALHSRQRNAVWQLAAVLFEAEKSSDMLIVAEQLRRGRLVVDNLTGRAGTEQMLDALFGTFCIGK
ncbi:tRNA uridine-5-carboxymethylaminomethyl(34) synthesis GTPase MnmE [Sphingobium sp. SCG-1]|uniref:tRNA uridine-5-carboxymethylaminomethyl(34) synthesis GTPase MnmE n=1 Tax=Sphingobium sp. SCG-1 TaxID=2072936 RepID=UPI000CD694E0|nr:tRNA uridine-5-carboxymethylaminomethyl(34) synthesis GTPase MnmE [Sphingobium sp. SCG-1]AUW56908.1 tRNA uridine-5-carboxymethylaminomethyl(34) synthesis GTPase MnmE [Sphingobium sp. SCG-1]